VQLTFETVDPADDTALRPWFDVRRAGQDADHAGLAPDRWEHVRLDFRVLPPTYRGVLRLARDPHGTPVAAMRHWLTDADNTDIDEVDLVVHPAFRRRGIGRAALDDVRAVAAAEGRRRVLAQVTGPVGAESPGDAFAASVGARMLLAELTRVLDLAALDGPRLAQLRADAEAHAGGYRLVQWAGDVPNDLVDGFARLRTQLMHDVPMGELEWSPEVFDAGRIRAGDEANRRRGRRRIATAAVHADSGELVAYTDIGTYVLPGPTAWQWDTLVLDKHRGHRLGLLIKLANLDLLREHAPSVQQVRAVNAADNRHMIAINEALGFVVAERSDEWQLDL
jgi:GNAT superfamily N-acetyltransferase